MSKKKSKTNEPKIKTELFLETTFKLLDELKEGLDSDSWKARENEKKARALMDDIREELNGLIRPKIARLEAHRKKTKTKREIERIDRELRRLRAIELEGNIKHCKANLDIELGLQNLRDYAQNKIENYIGKIRAQRDTAGVSQFLYELHHLEEKQIQMRRDSQ